MGRLLTFRQLQSEKGWPHSRQWTDKLVKDRKIPAPRKRPGSGSLNVWDEDEWNQYYSTFEKPLTLELTAALVDALSTVSIDGIVDAVTKLSEILRREGADPVDVVVAIKARPERGTAALHAGQTSPSSPEAV